MGKRKLMLNPEEISANFKKNKFDNANGIIELLIKLETMSDRHIPDCIRSLTAVALNIIKDGDIRAGQAKPEDLKDASDKYKDWIKHRFQDIVKKFIKLLHHSKSAVCECALTAIMSIVRQQSRTNEVFPWVIYSKVMSALLSATVDCRKGIRSMGKALQHQDLSYYTFKVVSKLVNRRGANYSTVYKGNLVAVLVQLQVPPRKKPVNPPPLWCSVRTQRLKIDSDEKEQKTVKKLSKKEVKKKEKKEKIKRSKGKYEEAFKQDESEEESADKEEEEEEEEEDEDEDEDEGKEEQEEKVNDVDNTEESGIAAEDVNSEEEQMRNDDQEFKSAQKIKKKRRRRGDTEEGMEGDYNGQAEPEDANKVVVGQRQLMPIKDRMLPLAAFSSAAIGDIVSSMDESQVEEEEEHEEEEETVGGLIFQYSYKLACQYLTLIWEKLMTMTLTDDLYRRCLVYIPDQVMDHLNDPIKLTDFFISSYNCGGGVSLMAMHGVFLLMNKHNLHYPDFYSKVYGLLEPSVFNARYKPRFFLLLGVFLSSTHLPEYIAAAFIKRLSLLLLYAPATCALLVVKTISNVLARFPGLRVLYDDDSEAEVTADPYCVSQPDMMASGATESSLWEIATVNISAPEKLYKATNFIKNATMPEMVDINDHLETEYDELDPSVEEYADNIKKVSENFKPVERLFNDPKSNFHYLFEVE